MVIYIQPVSNSDYFTHPFSTLINTQGLLHSDWTTLSHQDKKKIAIRQDVSKNALIYDTLFFHEQIVISRRVGPTTQIFCEMLYDAKQYLQTKYQFHAIVDFKMVSNKTTFLDLFLGILKVMPTWPYFLSAYKKVPITTFEQLLTIFNKIFGYWITIMKQFYTTSKTIC